MRKLWVKTRLVAGFVVVAAGGVSSCNATIAPNGGQGGNDGPRSGGASGSTASGGASGNTANGGAGGSGRSGGAGGGFIDGGAGAVVTGTGGRGTATCAPGVQAMLVTDCGYPMASSNPLTKVVFNESEVLRAIQASGGWPSATIRVFYNDEHALTLGVRQVVAKTAAGSTTTDYPVSPLVTDPGSAIDPQTGTNDLIGPQSGLDVSQRPMWPVLYITDITANPNDRSGDWQFGGRPRNPNAVYGSWKAAVRTVDDTVTPNRISILPDADPKKNNWNLGGGDPVPSGLTNQGFGAEVVWNVPLTPGHSYRLQAMVHDGDQSKGGGDTGQACVEFCAGGSGPPPDAGAPPSCPMGTTPCGQGIEGNCPSSTVCANGCCVRAPIIM